MNPAEYRRRLAAVVEALASAGVDACLIPASSNFTYLTGLAEHRTERLTAVLVRYDGSATLIGPAFEEGRLGANPAGLAVTPWEEHEDPFALAAALVAGARRLAVDPTTWFSQVEGLRRLLPSVELTSADAILRPLRAIKSEAEIACMETAVRATERGRRHWLASLRGNESTIRLREMLRWALLEAGGTEPVCGVHLDANTAEPHGGSAPASLRAGAVLMVDCGAAWGNYRADTTRTVVWGAQAGEQFRRVFDVVRRAQEAALAAVRPGARCGDVDAAGRRVIEEAGFGRYFTHRIGHGIGIDEHEPPYLVPGSRELLQPGHVVTIEPGIYLPGAFGVRLEDQVLVTEDGCRVLSDRSQLGPDAG